MHNRRNYYRLLHVQPEAPLPVIQASYRAMMQKLKMHPDLGGDHEIASLLNQAYQTLSDPQLRAEYDRQLNQQQLHSQQNQQSSHCLFCHEAINSQMMRQCPNCSIPLTPVQTVNNTSADKRALQRHPRNGNIHYTSDPLFPYQQAQCIDLTPTGIRLAIPEVLPIQTIIKLESPIMMAAGRVAHSEPGTTANGSKIGVEFITIAFQQAKSQFVDRQV